MKKVITTKNAPLPIGPYSQAVQIDNMLFASGQIPLDPETGNIVEGGIEEQTKRVMESLKEVLLAAETDFENIVKTTIFMKDFNDFPKMNAIYATYFSDNFPARSCVEVARLPKDVLIEIEAIAKI